MSETIGQDTKPTPSRRLLPSKVELDIMTRIANGIGPTSGISGCTTPEAALTRILVGWSAGIDAATSLNSIKAIEGRLTVPEVVAVAAIRASGVGDIRTVEVTNHHATVEVTRADWPADETQRVTFSLDDAQRAGLISIGSNGQITSRKNNWQNWTSDMMLARARAIAKRRYLEEAVGGLPHSPDELGAETDEDGAPVDLVKSPVPNFLRTPEPEQSQAAPDAPVSPSATVAPPPAPWQRPPTESPAQQILHAAEASGNRIMDKAADDVRQALTEVFEGPTAETLDRAKQMYATLGLDPVTWKILLQREHAGAKSLKTVLRDKAEAMVARLEKVARLRMLRQACNLSPNSWAAALRKRAVTQDVLLKAEDVDAIAAKLYDQVSPFERQRLGIDPTPEGSTAGKQSPPQPVAA